MVIFCGSYQQSESGEVPSGLPVHVRPHGRTVFNRWFRRSSNFPGRHGRPHPGHNWRRGRGVLPTNIRYVSPAPVRYLLRVMSCKYLIFFNTTQKQHKVDHPLYKGSEMLPEKYFGVLWILGGFPLIFDILIHF